MLPLYPEPCVDLSFETFPEVFALLQELHQYAEKNSTEIKLTLMGGMALGLVYHFPRFTHDLDVAISFGSKDPKLLELVGPRSMWRQKNHCYLQMVDDKIFFNYPGWQNRCLKLNSSFAPAIQLNALGAEDLIISKMGDRFNAKDQEDIFHLMSHGYADRQVFEQRTALILASLSDPKELSDFEKQRIWLLGKWQNFFS